jgi:hypothetical protein
MKIITIDAFQDIPVDTIRLILRLAIDLYTR